MADSSAFGAALWSLFWLGEVPALDFGFFTILNQSVLFVLALVALVWLTNLFNFMDGIDGLAGAELLFVTGFSLVTAITGIQSGGSVLFTVACASAAGFLVWNWHPARIFMGDVGSSFAGFFIGLDGVIHCAGRCHDLLDVADFIGDFCGRCDLDAGLPFLAR